MQANTGAGLYIRKGHTGAFKTTETITQSTNTQWMPVTGYSGTALTGADEFSGKFGYWDGSFKQTAKANDTMSYTAVTNPTQDNDSYTYVVKSGETNGIYYHFELDYMITAGKSLKVTATATAKKDGTTVTTDSPNIAQATRVGIIAASSYTKATGESTADTVDYASTGKEYTVAAPAKSGETGTDYNLEELKALGYKGTTEYKGEKTAITRLDEAGATITNTTALATTSDKAFEYGSLSVYVWFDGTDYSCTNAIFSQKVTFE